MQINHYFTLPCTTIVWNAENFLSTVGLELKILKLVRTNSNV